MLFDGRDLSRWRSGVFGEPADFELADDGVILPIGVPLAGLTYEGEAPSTPYELEVVGTKQSGTDFFLGITFPVRDEHLTLVLGGWGGVVSGLSCLDGLDASENETRRLMRFPNGKSTTVILRVFEDRVVARVDDETTVDVALNGRTLSIRPEVEPSVPLGVASYATCTTLHRVRVRGLPPRDAALDDSERTRRR